MEIVPQDKVSEDVIEPVVVAQQETVENALPKAYSTRSKEVTISKSAAKQKKDNVVIHPRLKPVPFKALDLHASKGVPSKNQVIVEKGITFYNSEDHPINKRGYKYKPCSANPSFPSNLYSTTEILPFKVCPSYFDRASGIIFNDSMDCVSTLDGWRSIRTNIGMREGSHYMEFNIVNANNGSDRSHVRVGIARREASLEAPVGFDGYGYGIRDVNGQKITLSRPKEFMKKGPDEKTKDVGFRSGDVIGMYVELPSLEEHRRHVERFVNSKREALQTKSASVGQTQALTLAQTPTLLPGTPTEATSGKAKKRKISSKKDVDMDNSNFQYYNNILRDQIPIKYKSSLYYEQYEYSTTKKMDHLLNPVTVFGERAILEKNHNDLDDTLPTIPNSKITVYKNGECIGEMFENLYSFLPAEIGGDDENNVKQVQNPGYRNTDDGSLGYYPMISVYQKGIVEFNAGPNFKYPPQLPDKLLQPLNSRYSEHVVEEWLWDVIDEVEAEYLDSYDE